MVVCGVSDIGRRAQRIDTRPYPLESVPKALQALPAALAAIAAALVGTFRWRDNQARFATAGETLKSELVYFQTRSTKWYDRKLHDDEAIDNFVSRMESLVLNETAEWRADLTTRPESNQS